MRRSEIQIRKMKFKLGFSAASEKVLIRVSKGKEMGNLDTEFYSISSLEVQG